uniref:Secreted protein n=1 Tax=Anguilla anguilla TaxID=7936 RepID=A0A0E9PSP8_ANGAN
MSMLPVVMHLSCSRCLQCLMCSKSSICCSVIRVRSTLAPRWIFPFRFSAILATSSDLNFTSASPIPTPCRLYSKLM